MGESEKVESWVEKMFEAMPMNLVGQAILFAVCSLSMHLIPHSSDSFGQAGFQSEAGSQLTQLCLNPCSVQPKQTAGPRTVQQDISRHPKPLQACSNSKFKVAICLTGLEAP